MFAVINRHSIVFAYNLAEGVEGTIRGNVELDPIPEDCDVWEDGDQIPQQILGESKSESGHYRLFKFERDIRGSGFESTGKNFAGIYEVYPR